MIFHLFKTCNAENPVYTLLGENSVYNLFINYPDIERIVWGNADDGFLEAFRSQFDFA